MTSSTAEHPSVPVPAACECLWICGRGPTRLRCQLRRHLEGDIEIEVLRNARLFGSYRFPEPTAAVMFAERLRHSFEGNGWTAAPAA